MAIRTDWRISRRGRACGGCGAEFPPEVPFHSVIRVEGEGFLRRDLCEACFAADGTTPYSHWVARIPRPDERRRAFDLGLAARFLRRLAEEAQPDRAPLAHLLALLLVRRRAARAAHLPPEAAGPRIRVEFSDGTAALEIPAPPLRDGDVPALRDQLSALLDLGERE